MLLKPRLNLWFLVPVLFFMVTSAFLMLVLPYGEELFLIDPWRVEPYNTLMRYFTLLGEWQLWVISTLVLCLKDMRIAKIIGFCGLFVMFSSFTAKEIAKRPRPMRWLELQQSMRSIRQVEGVHLHTAYTSFPSGHTTSGVTITLLLSVLFAGRMHRWIGLLLAAIAVLVAVSRVFLVQHFLSDIVAGTALGLGIGLLCYAFFLKQS
jgi:membrane-associated phospholipid phosphatase